MGALPSRLSVLLLGLVLLFSSGCAGFDTLSADWEDSDEPPIRTDQESYRLQRGPQLLELTIGLTYTNRTGGSVYLNRCHGVSPPVVEKWTGSAWTVVYDPPVLLCYEEPLEIPAGATFPYTYRIAAGPPGSRYTPTFETEQTEGSYRLAWRLLDSPDPDRERLLPLEERISNTFRITE